MQGTAGGEAFQFGAARDSQTAADTSQLSGNVSTGAATFAFIQVRPIYTAVSSFMMVQLQLFCRAEIYRTIIYTIPDV